MGKDESMKKRFILRVIMTVFMLSIWSCKETPSEPVTQEGPKPESLEDFVKLGNTNMDSGRYDDAIKYYTKALDIQPEKLHQRVPIYIGSEEDVKMVEKFMAEDEGKENQ